MTDYAYDLVVLGAGSGGLATSRRAASYGARVAIVDDVLTTGATLNELARNLRKAGAIEIQGWVVARTIKPD